MSAELALWHNAHRERQLAELLSEGACTLVGLAREAGVSENDASHIIARLRQNGLPVASIDTEDVDGVYRILYPAGRVCAAQGCATLLRRSNPSDRCELHGGGFLTVTLTRRPAAPPRKRRQAPSVDWRNLRELWGVSLREWARRAEVDPTFLSRIERGQGQPSPATCRKLLAALPMRREG